jgi:hypothetical protein
MAEEKKWEIPKRDPEEVIEMECECGEKIKGARKKIYYLYKAHQTDHPDLTPTQWIEAAKRIEKARERAKSSASQTL